MKHDIYVCAVLLLVLNLETCCGNYTCYQMSSEKDICFMFDGVKRTFEASKQICQNNSGFLLEIYNNETQRLVEQFGRNNKLIFENVWLNLVRTNLNEWVWGDAQSGNYLTYSNWMGDYLSPNGINMAFMDSSYKWINSYDPITASTICIQGSRELYLTETTSSLLQPPATGIGLGLGLDGMVLIIVSSLLISKCVFHKKFPLRFKSSGSTKSAPHERGSDVTNEVYDESKTINQKQSNNQIITRKDLVLQKSPLAYENTGHKNNNVNESNYDSLSHPGQDSHVYQALEISTTNLEYL